MQATLKCCPKCENAKPFSAFNKDRAKGDGHCSYCRDCNKEKSREWAQANPERKKRNGELNYLANRSRYIERSAEWKAKNPDRALGWARQRGKERRDSEPKLRLEGRMRQALRRCLIHGKQGKATFQALGFGIEELKRHMERQFHGGMSWENMGEWHIDHIIPLASFSFESVDDPDFRRAWALTNLRPLWGVENMRKGAKLLTLI